ncbi:MAG: FAD-dependent oxidoreductase [Candidatus Omnitrophica bacterium]|nr:FAD-dependent oxidoreductase [Candidatus Omnitrophota bacterium]
MKKIVIIGGGFCGLWALKVLSKAAGDKKILLIDRKKTFDFLPALPDIIGRQVPSGCLSLDLESVCNKHKHIFINAEVASLRLAEKKVILADGGSLSYDYCLISSGSQANFYGNHSLSDSSFTLGSVQDAKKILRVLAAEEFDTVFVAGGGYTGIEIATSLWRYFLKSKQKKKIVILEKSTSILGQLPDWMKTYVFNNLKHMGIEVMTNEGIKNITGFDVLLKSGLVNRAICIWAAGVKVSDFISSLDFPKTSQGRLKVDKYLRINKYCFAAGDAASFDAGGGELRMSVQFALSQGAVAAGNIIKDILGLPLTIFKPFDPGYVIPLANNHSCARIMGINSKGIISTIAHYILCVYRMPGAKNKECILRSLVKDIFCRC